MLQMISISNKLCCFKLFIK